MIHAKTARNIFLVLLFVGILVFVKDHLSPAYPSFVMTAAGDYGASGETERVLNMVREEKPALHLMLGDLSYDEIVPESAWCQFVLRYIKKTPTLIVAGNHESDGQNGLIENFTRCLPPKLSSIQGDYGKEYFADYPEKKPLVRFIMISPNLTFSTKETYSYATSTVHFAWLAHAISDARQKKIPWIVVGMHEVCISAGDKECEIGEDLLNYLLREKVDVVLQGHSHTYQRSRQLTCIKAGQLKVSCIADSMQNYYEKGKGSVMVIAGTGGGKIREVDPEDAEVGYFSMLNNEYGILRIEVTRDMLDASFKSIDNRMLDSFMIVK